MSIRTARTILPALIVAFAAQVALADDTSVAVPSMPVADTHEYVAAHEDAVILDVRTPAEFDASHITGAVNVNVQAEDFDALVASLDPGKTYLVHCTKNPADGRSSRAMAAMRELGFDKLYSIEGGYVAWKEAELPLTEAAP